MIRSLVYGFQFIRINVIVKYNQWCWMNLSESPNVYFLQMVNFYDQIYQTKEAHPLRWILVLSQSIFFFYDHPNRRVNILFYDFYRTKRNYFNSSVNSNKKKKNTSHHASSAHIQRWRTCVACVALLQWFKWYLLVWQSTVKMNINAFKMHFGYEIN